MSLNMDAKPSIASDLDAPVDSPCVKRCKLHPEGRFCTGCLRTLDEIAGWARMSNADRRRVIADLPSRR